jgi:acetoin:2,6-dichlorophenolindophenol oxidoreductase subunit alpha
MTAVHETAEAGQTTERWRHAYRQMVKIRFFEERVNELYRSAKMPGLAHLYSGEEAVAVGVCEALRQDDYITSTHRGHGHCLAKGAAVDRMFAELLGKEPGYCRGKGGSMHIADHENGNLGANAIVGGSTGIATGAAMSAQKRGTDQVAVCFFGDGALGQGVLYEVMNMAALWKLPVIYVCENNLYGEYTHYSETTAGEMIARAQAFGIPAEQVDGQRVWAVNMAARRAVKRARAGDGPTFLVLDTYRFMGHHVGDVDRAYYRSKDEEEEWSSARDPIALLAARLRDEGVAEETLDQIRAEAQQEVDAGVEFALAAPYPDETEVHEHVFVGD